MPQQLPPQFILDNLSGGVMNGVKDKLAPINSANLMINLESDEILGEAVSRYGSSLIGTAIDGSNNIENLYNFIASSGSINKLICSVDGTMYYYSGTAWVSSGYSGTASEDVFFDVLLDEVIKLNGTDSPVTSANGTSWAASVVLDTANMPVGKFVKTYKDQLTIAGVSGSPDSLYVSSVPSSGGAISWTSGNREIVINPEDGQNIQGLGVVSGVEVIFKDRAMYRWNNRATESEQIVNVGTTHPKSIVNVGTYLSFFNEKGFWLTDSGFPVLISKPINKWVKGKSASWKVGCYGDEEYLYGALGDCTVDGESYSNVVIRYSVWTKEFVVYSYANQVRNFTSWYDSNLYKITAGDNLSQVLYLEDPDVMADNGTAISCEVRSHELDFGSRGMKKDLSERLLAYGRNSNNMMVQVIEGNENGDGDWKNIGTMDTDINNFLINKQIQGNYLKFRVVGLVGNDRFYFKGLEAPKITILDYAK